MLHCHGKDDPIINYKLGTMTSEILNKMNSKYKFISYEGLMHGTNEKVIIKTSK